MQHESPTPPKDPSVTVTIADEEIQQQPTPEPPMEVLTAAEKMAEISQESADAQAQQEAPKD